MRLASYQFASDWRRAPARRRATGFALAIAVELLFLFALLRLAPTPPPAPKVERPVTFSLSPAAQDAARPAPRKQTVAKARPASSVLPPPRPIPPVPSPLRTPQPTETPDVILLDKDAFAATDIGALPSRGAGAGSGEDSGSVYGPGEGPGGERLFNAEWYVEPTRAELAYYLPRGGAPPGWALIACRTIENYHVENCRALGESPVGSGLARALRQAAWQFRVRPPRIGGRPMIGAWVRIRFDFTTGKAQ